MLKQKYFLTGIFILSAERQPIKLAWRKIVWLRIIERTGLSGYDLSRDCKRASDTAQISFVQGTFRQQLYFLSLSIKRISQPVVRLWSQRKRTNIAKFSFGQNTIIGSSATRTLYKKYILRSEYILR